MVLTHCLLSEGAEGIVFKGRLQGVTGIAHDKIVVIEQDCNHLFSEVLIQACVGG